MKTEGCFMEGQGQYLTVGQLADELQVPEGTIYQWRHKGYGPPGIKIGRHVRFRRDDVERWVDEQKAA